MRVLHIEDDLATAQAVELMLKSEGMVVDHTEFGEEGIDLAKHYAFDLIVLDGHLSDMDGLDVLRKIRAAKIATPVLMLSGSSNIEHKAATFGAGADDFLSKPFHKDELVMRIRAIVRRANGLAESKIEIEGLTVNFDAKRVLVNGDPIHLTGKEYATLELLALRRGAMLTKQVILDHLYGGMDEPEMKIVDVFVCKVRKKLRDAGLAADLIQTTWGRGYTMQAAA